MTEEARFCSSCGARQPVGVASPEPVGEEPVAAAPHDAVAIQAEAPAAAPTETPPQAGTAPRRRVPTWAWAAIAALVFVAVALPVGLLLPSGADIGFTMEDVTPGLNEEIAKAQEAAAKSGIDALKGGLAAWAAEHGSTYPAASVVTAGRFKRVDGTPYVDPWPQNKFVGADMTQGTEPGQYTYVRGADGASYTLTGFGEDGTVLVTAP